MIVKAYRDAMRKIAAKLDVVAAFAVFAMMGLTCADVVCRLFRHPIRGTYEVVSFLGVVAAAFAMAHTSAEKGHVSVNLLVRLLPEKLQGIIEFVMSLLSVALFAILSWRSVLYAEKLRASGEVSLTLQLPFYPIVLGLAVASAMACLVLLANVFAAFEKITTGNIPVNQFAAVEKGKKS